MCSSSGVFGYLYKQNFRALVRVIFLDVFVCRYCSLSGSSFGYPQIGRRRGEGKRRALRNGREMEGQGNIREGGQELREGRAREGKGSGVKSLL